MAVPRSKGGELDLHREKPRRWVIAADRERSGENNAVESGKIVADERFGGEPEVSSLPYM